MLELNPEQVYERLQSVAEHQWSRLRFPVTPSYRQWVYEALIRPGAIRLTEEGKTEEQLLGAEEKLRVILAALDKESRQLLAVGEAGELVGEQLANIALSQVLRRLCPIWPFC